MNLSFSSPFLSDRVFSPLSLSSPFLFLFLFRHPHRRVTADSHPNIVGATVDLGQFVEANIDFFWEDIASFSFSLSVPYPLRLLPFSSFLPFPLVLFLLVSFPSLLLSLLLCLFPPSFFLYFSFVPLTLGSRLTVTLT